MLPLPSSPRKPPASLATWAHRVVRHVVPSMGTVRVLVYASCAFAVAAIAGARLVYADVKEATLAASRELSRLGDLTSGHETLLVNGERLHRASAFTSQSISEVLNRYEAYCSASPSVLGRAVQDIPQALQDKAFEHVPMASMRLGIVREEQKDHGMVGCFIDDRPGGMAAVPGRVQRFLETGNMSEFGKFRHVYVETAKNGETHVITSWADGPLNPSKMFPAVGDSAGSDSPFMPRPPRARRILTGAAEGMPFGVRVYESAERAPALWKVYDDYLKDKGFAVVAAPEGSETKTYMRDDTLEVYVTVSEEDEKTFVTLLETGRVDGMNMARVRAGE